jgi:hypothetical protein
VTNCPFTWNSGRPQRTVRGSPSVSVKLDAAQASNTSLPWVRTAIFGDPVVPPVHAYDEMSDPRISRPATSRSEGCSRIASRKLTTFRLRADAAASMEARATPCASPSR